MLLVVGDVSVDSETSVVLQRCSDRVRICVHVFEVSAVVLI